MNDAPASIDLLITNVAAVVGGARDEQYRVVPDVSIGISERRIVWIGEGHEGELPKAAKLVDGQGMYAFPASSTRTTTSSRTSSRDSATSSTYRPWIEMLILPTADEMTPEETYPRAALAEADRERGVQPRHRADGRRSASSAGWQSCGSSCAPSWRRWRPPGPHWASTCPSRSSAGPRWGSRSATTGPRCCRTSRLAKPLELDSLTGAVLEIAGRVGVETPHVRTIHAYTKLVELLRSADHESVPTGA